MPSQNSDIIYAVVAISTVIVLLVSFILLILVIYYKRRRKFLLRQSDLQKQFERALLQTRLEIQEQTFQYISRELHDNLSQVASVIKIYLTTISLDNHQKAYNNIEEAKELTRQLISDIKTLSLGLGDHRISQTGLTAAIQLEVERINRTGQFNCAYEQEGTALDLAADRSLILFRMVQELLNNCIKHSGASAITVKVNIIPNFLTLVVSDNGRGFDPASSAKGTGSGLINLRERASIIHATLRIDSKPGLGSTSVVELTI